MIYNGEPYPGYFDNIQYYAGEPGYVNTSTHTNCSMTISPYTDWAYRSGNIVRTGTCQWCRMALKYGECNSCGGPQE